MKQKRALVLAGTVMGLAGLAYGQEARTFTGTVTDAMCGAKHTMGISDPAKCTRECVKAGSAYALVVGSKVYKLKGDTTSLNGVAGEKASVRGTLSGDTITVQSVGAKS